MFDEMFEDMFGPDWRLMVDAKGKQTTPSEFTSKMKSFAKFVGGKGAHLKHIPVVGGDGLYGACHLNTEQFCKQFGGRVIYGWVLWASRDYMEAEFHSIVELNGQYACLTPQRDGEESIAFFPDMKGRKIKTTSRSQSEVDFHTFLNVPNGASDVCASVRVMPKDSMERCAYSDVVRQEFVYLAVSDVPRSWYSIK